MILNMPGKRSTLAFIKRQLNEGEIDPDHLYYPDGDGGYRVLNLDTLTKNEILCVRELLGGDIVTVRDIEGRRSAFIPDELSSFDIGEEWGRRRKA